MSNDVDFLFLSSNYVAKLNAWRPHLKPNLLTGKMLLRLCKLLEHFHHQQQGLSRQWTFKCLIRLCDRSVKGDFSVHWQIVRIEGFPTLFPRVQSAGEMGEKEGTFSYLFTCKRGERRGKLGGNVFPRFSLDKSREPLGEDKHLNLKTKTIIFTSSRSNLD